MKILIFNTLYYPHKIGGAEVSVQILAEELAKKNQVTVVSLSLNNETFYKNGVLVNKWKTPNIVSVQKIQTKSFLTKIIWHLIDSFNLVALFKAVRLIRSIKPDVVHFNNLSGFSPSILLATKIMGIKGILTLRDYYIICHKSTAFNIVNRSSCEKKCLACKITYGIKNPFVRMADDIVALSDGQRLFFGKHTSIEIKHVIPNSVVEKITATNLVGDTKAKICFGFIGRGSIDKGYFYLINEFLQFKHNNNGYLHVAGRVDQKDQIADTNIIYHGFVDPEYFFQQIDILIVPSLWEEPFGRVVIEALNAKKIVLCSDVGGLSDFAGLDNVLHFQPIDGLLCQLMQNIKNEDRKFSEKENTYSLSAAVTAEMYEKLYKKS